MEGEKKRKRENLLTLVALVLGNLLRSMLHLEQELDTLNGSYSGLGDGGRDTAGKKVLDEGGGVERHLQ